MVQYTYGDSNWKDKLTAYNGQQITYDEIGNPLSYYNGLNFTWKNGRTLSQVTTATGKVIKYIYDDTGNRIFKKVAGAETYFHLNGTQISVMKTGNSIYRFSYDGAGQLYSINFNGETYYYFFNVQGDVIGLYDSNLNVVVRYTYDSWGKLLSTTGSLAGTLGQANPFRYRGYYYDTETGFYYVSSRYYDPEVGRFINADNQISGVGSDIRGYNLFAYCFNNPVNMNDPSGNWPQWMKNAAKVVASFVTQVKAVLSIPSTVLKIAAVSTIAVVSGQATVEDVVNDVKNYSFFNTDETKVLDSKVFSSYKGTPVLKHNISGVTSFSVSNTIILNKGETVSNGGIDTVKHEWGHTVQQSLIGTQKYMTRIAVPSVISCIVNPSSKTYYSLPWERSADFFGGANRTTGYHAGSDVVAGLYLIIP